MNNYSIEQPSNWNRESTYEFFKTFEIPFYNITANVDVSNLKAYCDKNNLSFLVTALFLSQKTISQIPNFRYRFVDNEVRLYEKTQAGCTILLENESFAFCYFSPLTELTEFVEYGTNAIKELKSNPNFAPRDGDANMVFYSVIPWLSFTSFQHARRFEKEDSIPRIVFGKYSEINKELQMPISVEVHHSFVDGLHVGRYFHILQNEINALKV
jgi:chloramphenicol O-acetyltransferase type A